MAPYDLEFANDVVDMIIDSLSKYPEIIPYLNQKVFPDIGREEFEREKEIKTRTFEDIVKPQFDNIPFDIMYQISLKPSPSHEICVKPEYMEILFTFKIKETHQQN